LSPGDRSRELQPLDVHRGILEPPADSLGGQPAAFGQEIADSLAVGNLPEDSNRGLVIAELEVQAVGVLSRQDATLVQLHGHGHRGAEGDGVQSQLVAEPIHGDAGAHVRDAHVAPQGVERLELGPLARIPGVWTGADVRT